MRNESETVFLTGASGFVGSHVLRALLDGGYRIRALTRSNGDRGIAESNDHERVEYITGDLHAAGALTEHLRGCRYLVHVAALYSFAPG
ncbi:MAG TPA: NAD-dependent epimerase/dehydratase family protein, partial [Chloroflexota bacterium]|nr:NAD-dependent epimerase/dehydratase family protein [Chloroflexota bacterium]